MGGGIIVQKWERNHSHLLLTSSRTKDLNLLWHLIQSLLV
jgi:hypothetical protein